MIVRITALLDSEHEAELRVRASRAGVEIECEDWSGDERRTTRLVASPDEAVAFARSIMIAARTARARQRTKGPVTP